MTASPPPLFFNWGGEAMIPVRPGIADRYFVVGEKYPLVIHEERSDQSHKHFFASIHEAWLNLPEDVAERFVTSEHFRKWLLIKSGYRDERSITCASKAEALRLAAFVRPMDEFAVVVVTEATVVVYTAKSQSKRAMGAKVFQASKQACLDEAAAMIKVDPETLAAHAGKAA